MKINVALIQCAFGKDANENQQKILHFAAQAKKLEAHVVLPPELHQGHYFCKSQDDSHFLRAIEVERCAFLKEAQKACRQLEIVLAWSFFEKSGPHFFNSLAMIDASGDICGIYRKSHIPDGPGYQEKFYFRPGNTGFKVFATKYGRLGAAICWDQWFPEAARIMALKGAEILLYPTAIGSEPHAPGLSTKEPWLRVMKGHAVANMIPVAAANRIGVEEGQSFYGNSFACDEFGQELINLNDNEAVGVVEIDLEKAAGHRASFGFFRDRRTDLYHDLITS